MLALIALAIASAATLVVPIAVRRMIDFGFSDSNAGLIRAYFFAMIGVVAVLALASGARYYLVMTLGERVVADLRADLFTHLTRLDPSFFDSEKTGDIASRLSADTTQLKATFGSSASLALRNLFLFVGAITMMVVTSPKLSAFVLAAIPVIVLPLYAAGRSVRERSRRAQDRLADATAFATESLSAVRVMQSFLAERFTAGRYREAAFGAYEAARAMSPSARARHRSGTVPRFRQRRRRALARRAGSDRPPDDRRRLVAVRAVRRVRRRRAWAIVGSVERGLAGGGRRGPHRRDPRGQATHRCAR